MNYQYAIWNKNSYQQEVWVCEGCRNAHSELILIGKWRLVDRNSDPGLQCDTCSIPKQIAKPQERIVSTMRRFLA